MDFKLRSWSIDDREALTRNANNRLIAKFMTDGFPHPYNEADAERFIEMATSNTPANILCIEVDGEASGGIGIHPQADIHRMNAELGYWLAEHHWGKGIITKAIKEMVDYAFTSWDFQRIYAIPYGTNIGSQRVLEKAGFQLEATLEKTIIKNDEMLDELIFAIRRKDWKK